MIKPEKLPSKAVLTQIDFARSACVVFPMIYDGRSRSYQCSDPSQVRQAHSTLYSLAPHLVCYVGNVRSRYWGQGVNDAR